MPWLGLVRLSWEDSRGETRFAHAKCIDVSESGIRLECPAPIENGTRILLSAERIKLSGAGMVKHATRYSSKYFVGLELAQSADDKTIAALRGPACAGEKLY